jgi:hypothetical protein
MKRSESKSSLTEDCSKKAATDDAEKIETEAKPGTKDGTSDANVTTNAGNSFVKLVLVPKTDMVKQVLAEEQICNGEGEKIPSDVYAVWK